MPVINSLAALHEDMTTWRRDLHAHPETAFEEVRTAGIVAEKLESWGIEVHRGLATTGVVGVLRGRHAGRRAIGLRADMDALPMTEANDLPYASRHPGKFHGCGHDGHTTMLLGAARYLAETRNFAGTVHFIFQPAEEGQGGGEVMVRDGLFDRFPTDEIYAMHNWPDLPPGTVGVRSGPMMAAADVFDITIHGTGAHAALPHQGVDPIVIAGQVLTALQTLVARRLDPLDSAVVSVTQMRAGEAFNVIPDSAWLSGTVRTFKAETKGMLREAIGTLAEGVAEAHGATAEYEYRDGYPATVNHPAETDFIAEAAAAVVGPERVRRNVLPVMGAEDFAFMLQKRPGAYIWVGQGRVGGGGGVHSPRYDFNDEILPIGASLFATLAEQRLKPAA